MVVTGESYTRQERMRFDGDASGRVLPHSICERLR